MRFNVLNDTKRDHVSHGLLVGITPGNTVLHTWEFDIPISSKDSTISIRIPLGNMIDIFDNQGPDQDGISFFILLPSSDMPKVSTLPLSAITIFDTPQESEITFSDFPFKSQKAGTNSYSRLLAYRFRAYESVYNAYYRDIRNNPFVVNGRPVYNQHLQGALRLQKLYKIHRI